MIPAAALVAFLLFAGYVIAAGGEPSKSRWMFPAAASLSFLLFSLHAIAAEGLFGFWTEHTRNLWGNQIWLDLLLAMGIAWFFVVPHAKALGMRPAPWLALVVCTGCIGFLAMTARLLYLRDRVGAPAWGGFDAGSGRSVRLSGGENPEHGELLRDRRELLE